MALKPEYLQGLPKELEDLAIGLETDILSDAARRIAKAGQITDTAAYQIMRMKELGASNSYIAKRLAEFTEMSQQTVERLIFEAAQTDSEFYERVYRKVGLPYTPFEYNEYLQQLARAAVTQTVGELHNLTQSMGFAVRSADGRLYFTSTARAYQKAMDEAEMLVASGGMDYDTAIRRATANLTGSGLQFVDYATGVRNHVDVAVRRALLTGIGQMTGRIAENNAAQLGTDIVETTAHQGARPDHSVWQGRWFSLHGKDKRYPSLERETGYGTVTGLKGANCRHDFFPVIPGIDKPSYTEEQLRRMDEPITVNGVEMPYYEAEQKQRAYERAIRKTKRELICAESSGDEERFKEKSVLLRRQRQAYKDFSRDAGIPVRGGRLGVEGYGRKESAKSVWTEKKAKGLTNHQNSSIIKTREETKAIIAKAREQTRPIFAVDDKVRGPFATNVSHVPPKEGYFDIAIHGNPQNAEFFGEPIDAKTLAKIIRNRDDYPKGSKIRLLSCSTGKITDTANCFAQQLANELGVEIEAPTEDIFVYPNGYFIIGKNNKGKMKTFYPRE